MRLRLSSLGTPETRAPTASSCRTTCARTRTSSPARSARRIDLNPLRAFDSDHPGTRAVMADAPLLLDRSTPRTPSTSPRSARCSTRAGVAYEIDPTLVRGLDYYTRTVFEFTSDALGAQSGVGGGGRYDGLIEQLGGPPTPGCGWAAGIERMLLAGGAAAGRAAAGRPLRRVRRDGARADAFALAAEARRARMGAQLELAGRSRKGQLKQADRLGARYVAIVATTGRC